MTKTLASSIILTCALTLPANAENKEMLSGTSSSNVRDFSNLSVTFSGYLLKSMNEDAYLFRDDAGDVEVKIENTLWRDMELSGANQVKLIGRKDDHWQDLEIEIDSARLV